MQRRQFLEYAGLAGLAAMGVAAPARGGVPTLAKGRGPRYGMLIDLKRCVGCQACTVSCCMENTVPQGEFRTSVGEYALTPPGEERMYIAPLPRLCNHCKNPPCLPVCPVRATYQHDNGIVVVDAKVCIGCGFCVQACPYDARFLNRQTRTADKCTFCAHRLEAGLLPVCVESCVGGARLFGDLNAPHSLLRCTLDAHKNDIKVLYPEKGTEPFVFYLHLDEVFVRAASVAQPMSPRLPHQEGSDA